jgi:hypothetical protein
MASNDLTVARRDALFASTLQRGDHVDATTVRDAIRQAVRGHGVRGCAGRVAQEFGDHPDLAAARMRWVRTVIVRTYRSEEHQVADDEFRAVERAA